MPADLMPGENRFAAEDATNQGSPRRALRAIVLRLMHAPHEATRRADLLRAPTATASQRDFSLRSRTASAKRWASSFRRAARRPPVRSARPVLAGRATRGGAAEGIPRAIGLVKRIDATHAAAAADRLPALIKGREVTVRSATSPAAAVIRAPRIQRITALLSARRQAGESQSNSCKKKRSAHVDLPFQSRSPSRSRPAEQRKRSPWVGNGAACSLPAALLRQPASAPTLPPSPASCRSSCPAARRGTMPARSPALRRHARDT